MEQWSGEAYRAAALRLDVGPLCTYPLNRWLCEERGHKRRRPGSSFACQRLCTLCRSKSWTAPGCW